MAMAAAASPPLPTISPAAVTPALSHPSVSTPNRRLLRRLADAGRLNAAVALLDRTPVDLISYTILLTACGRRRNLALGRHLHRRFLSSDISPDAGLANSLISLYANCGHVSAAHAVFSAMPSHLKTVVSFAVMAACFAKHSMPEHALHLFDEMLHLGFPPNEYTFSAVLTACSFPSCFPTGFVILGFLIKSGFWAADVVIGATLVDMFSKNGDFDNARRVFDQLANKNAVVCTLMITRYRQFGYADDAAKLFVELLHRGEFVPDGFMMSGIISACSELASVNFGRQMHSAAIRLGLISDACVGASLVDMYVKFGSIEYARGVFNVMPEHNVMSFTALFSGYARRGECVDAIGIFHEMLSRGIRPTGLTYSVVLKSCTDIADCAYAAQVHGHAVKSSAASMIVVGNAVVTAYAQFGRVREARRAFTELYEHSMVDDGDERTDSFAVANLLSAAASASAVNKGQIIHARAIKSGFESATCVGNSLVSMYSSSGDIDAAERVFSEIECPNVVSWTAMISGFAKHGLAHEALNLFRDMAVSGVKPNEVTYVAVLLACSHAGLVEEGREHFRLMRTDHGLMLSAEHCAVMVDMLGRAGLLEDALQFIHGMPISVGALVWKTLVGACTLHGNVTIGELAAERLRELDSHDPAVTILLSNLYADVGRWPDVARLRSGLRVTKQSKDAGLSWIEVGNAVHEFYSGDTRHSLSRDIYAKLDALGWEIAAMGYVPDTDSIRHDMEDDDEFRARCLLMHSERIAVAFGLLCLPAQKPIRVFKNLRVCCDCHVAIKYMSKAAGREIILRDATRFHRFRNGRCSCGDYW